MEKKHKNTRKLSALQKKELESLGFYGSDFSMDVSLFEYNMLYSEEMEYALYYYDYDGKGGRFYCTSITKDEVTETLEDISPDFYRTTGTNPEAYKKLNIACKIEDLNSYFGAFSSHINFFNQTTMTQFIRKMKRIRRENQYDRLLKFT